MADLILDQPKITAVDPGLGTGGVLAVALGCAIFIVVVATVSCMCYRRRSGHKKLADRPVTLRRPTAVRNPSAHSHYLKKSPSPTGVKSPPGAPGPGISGVPGVRSPSGLCRSPLPGGSNTPLPPSDARTPTSATPKSLSPADDSGKNCEYDTVKYVSERDKPTTPSKEELELNERNLNKPILGKLHFKLRYYAEKSALIVSVVKCTDLPAKDPNMTSSDPYVKLQLLPEKQHKAKTRVLRKTLNPEYDEDFTFYGITLAQLQNITLHFVVLSFDRYSRDDIIGEVVAPLEQVDLSAAEGCLALCRDINPRSLKGRGELLVSLCHQPAANRLTVVVLKARNLPKMDITGLSDPYVKIYLLYNGQRVSKKKTHVKKRTLNPVFNESFVFDLPSGAENLDNVSLEFLLLDWDRVTKNEVIGRLELGGPRSAGSAQYHWADVVRSPRRQIAEWHKLRE